MLSTDSLKILAVCKIILVSGYFIIIFFNCSYIFLLARDLVKIVKIGLSKSFFKLVSNIFIIAFSKI